MPKRILVASLVGVASGAFCWLLLARLHQGAADFHWPLHLAQRLVERQNPYDTPLEQYPLPAALPALFLLHVPPTIAAGLFYGISSFLLCLGLTRQNFVRLRVFLAYPYWAGLFVAQWSTLIAASAFFPLLLPVTMMKPQVGIPVFFTHISRRGLVACALLLALSLIAMPQWPGLWLRQAHQYQHFIPLFVWPGPLLLFALARYRQRDTWLLLLSSLMPQRWFFDSFTLWLIPKTRREIVLTAGFSWAAGIWRWYHIPSSFAEVGRASVLFFYLPMLLVLLLRNPAREIVDGSV